MMMAMITMTMTTMEIIMTTMDMMMDMIMEMTLMNQSTMMHLRLQ